jgi:hypothetical protein
MKDLFTKEIRKQLRASLLYREAGTNRKPDTELEETLQRNIANSLKAQRVLFNHPPNEMKANKGWYGKREGMGTRAGWPDLEIMEARGQYHGLFIEIKRGSNLPSDHQLQCLVDLRKNGYVAYWVHNYRDLCHLIDKYLKQ